MNHETASKKPELKESPQEKANFLSKLTFWWLKDIYKLGSTGNLNPGDIYKLPRKFDGKLVTNKFIKLWTDELKKKKPRLLRILFKTFGFNFAVSVLCYSLVDIAMRITHSLCIGGLVNYFSQAEPEVTTEIGFMYTIGLIGSLSLSTIVYHSYTHYISEVSAQITIGFTGLIYRKALQLPLSSTYQSMNGIVINLIADDLTQFDSSFQSLHNVWKGPIEMLIFGYFIYREIGLAGIAGIILLLCFTPLQAFFANKTANSQNDLSKCTDIRVRIMSEIVVGIRLIKMYGLEHVFRNVITKVRRDEIRIIKIIYRIRALLVSLSLLTRYSIFVSLVTYLYMGYNISPRSMFITFSFFNLLNWSMLWQWPFALIHFGQGFVVIKRIQKFLLKDESTGVSLKWTDTGSSGIRTVYPKHEANSIILRNVTSKWKVRSNRTAGIYGVNLNIPKGEHCTVIGPVGSGKSSLLHVITGELKIEKGECEVYGRISYASQVPWIFEGTVRENIVFSEKFDEQKYEKIIRVCCLEADIAKMPYKDFTMVGECGFSLSGGQRARINLARAIYQTADIYILDNPLVAVDDNVGKCVFRQCIQEYLADHSCILATNGTQYLQDGQHFVVLRDGQIEIQGSYEEIKENKIFSSLNVESRDINVDEETERTKSLLSVLTILADEHYQSRRFEQKLEGSRYQVLKFYFSSMGNIYYLSLLMILFLVPQSLLSAENFFITNWNAGTNWEMMNSVPKIKALDIVVDGNSTENVSNHPDSKYVATYAYLLTFGTVAYICRTYAFFSMCLRASIAIHDGLFDSILRSTIVFFDINPSGRILNRFSKDLNEIDSQFPQALIECFSFVLEFLASIILVSIIVSSWMLIPSFFISIFFCAIRYVYTSTSRSVRRIEGVSLSPLYSHINNTLRGVSTIRTCGVQDAVQEEFYEHLNYNTAVLYIKTNTSLAFSFWVDVVCLVYIGICSVTFVLFREHASSDYYGLALLHSINLIGMCQWGTRDSAEIENETTSVERIIEYKKLPSEAPLHFPHNQLSFDWPSSGEIIFKNVYLKYPNSSTMTLKNLNFKINAAEKIGIIGRTGAGKTSIIEAIFRMHECDGEIIIDGIVTNTLGLHDLRKQISIIPENPILFSETLRFNLDPFYEKSDSQLWHALDQVEMKEFVKSLPGGLDYILVKSGTNFSMGQRQLISLARAILRNNKILISDEATASVDPETDYLIQNTIRTNFSNCTVITISHQLRNVMDSDRILIIENGTVIEFDHPYVLVTSPDGYLRRLINQSNPITARILTQIAKKKYNSLNII